MGNKRMSEEGLKRLEALKLIDKDDLIRKLKGTEYTHDLERDARSQLYQDIRLVENLPDAAPDLLAALRAERETVEYLRRVAEQARGSYGMSLPEPPIKGDQDFISEEPETDEEFAERLARHMPYGDATVMFLGSDECWYPRNCPDLARFLREQQGEGEKG